MRGRGGAYGAQGLAGHGSAAGRGRRAGERGRAPGHVGPVHGTGRQPQDGVEDVVLGGLGGRAECGGRLGPDMCAGHPQGEEQHGHPRPGTAPGDARGPAHGRCLTGTGGECSTPGPGFACSA